MRAVFPLLLATTLLAFNEESARGQQTKKNSADRLGVPLCR
jgi:hypothetical protein